MSGKIEIIDELGELNQTAHNMIDAAFKSGNHYHLGAETPDLFKRALETPIVTHCDGGYNGLLCSGKDVGIDCFMVVLDITNDALVKIKTLDEEAYTEFTGGEVYSPERKDWIPSGVYWNEHAAEFNELIKDISNG